MRRLRYSVATSLDGFIAGPKGEYDWIVFDSSFDFGLLYGQFDTLLMGRHTYEIMIERGMSAKSMGMRAFVASTTLDPDRDPDVTVIREDLAQAVASLKAETGKDIWLCGGASLFRQLLELGLVDSVEVTVIPILLGSGINLVSAGSRCLLRLESCLSLSSGILQLKYSVEPAPHAVQSAS